LYRLGFVFLLRHNRAVFARFTLETVVRGNVACNCAI
jgi:hypothetical protein